jgi:hypothetical protein
MLWDSAVAQELLDVLFAKAAELDERDRQRIQEGERRDTAVDFTGLPERPGVPVGWGEDATSLADFTFSPPIEAHPEILACHRFWRAFCPCSQLVFFRVQPEYSPVRLRPRAYGEPCRVEACPVGTSRAGIFRSLLNLPARRGPGTNWSELICRAREPPSLGIPKIRVSMIFLPAPVHAHKPQ